MSHDSYLCGFIKLGRGLAHNELDKALAAIAALPAQSDQDTWPFLTSAMFHYTPSPEYRDRIIHFAASYKNICGSWAEWEQKFEQLLACFDYDEVKILIEDCYMGDFLAGWRWEDPDEHSPATQIKFRKPLSYYNEPDTEFSWS